jgi:porin
MPRRSRPQRSTPAKRGATRAAAFRPAIGGAGIVRSAVFHETDQLGFAIGVATLGDPYRQALAAAGESSDSREENFELTYRIAINDWLTLQPDVQYVPHPGMNPEVRNAWLVGLRFELAAGWER